MMKQYRIDTFKTFLLLIFLALSFGLLVNCGSSNNLANEVVYNELEQLVNSRNFEIENEWANPQGGSQINLIGNTNYVKFKADSVEIFLPYFGVRHSGGGYGGEGGIKYKGLAGNLQITENSGKRNIEIKFEANQQSENLEFFIKLYSNGNAMTTVNSSQRSTISYHGKVQSLKNE